MARKVKTPKIKKRLLDLRPPKDMVYEGKVVRLYDEPVDARVLMEIEAAGWMPVPQNRHPKTPVFWGGMRLMERPAVMSKMAVAKSFNADQRQRDHVASGDLLAGLLPAGFWVVSDADAEMPMIATDKGWEPNPKYKP